MTQLTNIPLPIKLMKKYILILVLLAVNTAFCQDTESKEKEQKAKKDFRFEPSGRIKMIYPIQFGHHSLSKAHDANIGFGWSLSFFNYKNFRFSPGFDWIQYKVTDHELVGNFSASVYNSFHGTVSYEIPVTESFSVLPDLGFGYVMVNQKTSNHKFGTQEGNEIRAGFTADYKTNKFLTLFISARFIHTNLNMETDPAYIDFYGKANQIQLALGLKFN